MSAEEDAENNRLGNGEFMTTGKIEMTRISKGTGTLSERFWCRVWHWRGHKLGDVMPKWFRGQEGRICERCGGVYDEDGELVNWQRGFV